jgi:hypothetical protein
MKPKTGAKDINNRIEKDKKHNLNETIIKV